MTEKMTFCMVHMEARRRAAQRCYDVPDGWMITFAEPTRSLEQNAKFHALVTDIAKSGAKWAGKERTAAQWKMLLVSGFSEAMKEEHELVQGIEGELVNLRESTASMSKSRSASLIEYTLAFCAHMGIKTACHL